MQVAHPVLQTRHVAPEIIVFVGHTVTQVEFDVTFLYPAAQAMH